MTDPATIPGQWQISDDGPVRTLRLDRPARANAYTAPLLDALDAAVAAADRDASVRILVITGTGERSFCAGADRDELAQRDWRSVLRLQSAAVFERLRRSRPVSIAAINGAAVGGGLELALACDLRIAVPQARFWLPEPEFGLIPAAGGTALLARVVGTARARALVLGGETWTAQEAHNVGLLTAVATDSDLKTAMAPWITRILARDADALTVAKMALLAADPTTDPLLHQLAQATLVGRAPSP
jgi:enoyl-CoA hydratase